MSHERDECDRGVSIGGLSDRSLGQRVIFAVVLWIVATASTDSLALVSEVVNYVRQNQIGIDYTNSIDRVELAYDTAIGSGVPDSCEVIADATTMKRCRVSMIGGSSSGWGIFLQKAFQKKGFYYLDWDVSFGVRYLNGELPTKEQSLSGLPLKHASFRLGAVVMKPYVQFGITPDRWPDVLISMGPALQVAVGTVSINNEAENVAVGTSSVTGPMSVIRGFLALELVLKRFGEGAFSLIASHDVSGHGQGTKIYPKDIDGMTNFRGSFSRSVGNVAYGFGLKLVTPWP
jgi:hypothetical protein